MIRTEQDCHSAARIQLRGGPAAGGNSVAGGRYHNARMKITHIIGFVKYSKADDQE